MELKLSNEEIAKQIEFKDLIEITKSFLKINEDISLEQIKEEIERTMKKDLSEKSKKDIINNDLFLYKIIKHFEVGEIEYNNEEKMLLKEAFLIDKNFVMSNDFKEELRDIAVYERGQSMYSFEQIRRFIEKKLKA